MAEEEKPKYREDSMCVLHNQKARFLNGETDEDLIYQEGMKMALCKVPNVFQCDQTECLSHVSHEG